MPAIVAYVRGDADFETSCRQSGLPLGQWLDLLIGVELYYACAHAVSAYEMQR